MTRTQFVEDLRREFENVTVMALVGEPALEFVRVDRALPVLGTDVSTRVAFKVPDAVVGRPQQYVEPPTHLRSGGQPNNAACQEIGGQLWKTWSLETPWRPERHSSVQLVHTILSVWDR